jgi:L-ascorbate metabolism protein UlaG (beta-lactamase superfamily)
MEIKFFGYNSFIIKSKNKKIAIDPGVSLYLFDFFKSLIPKSEWSEITHILVTHGDPDHYWYLDRILNKFNPVVVCNSKMVKKINGKELMLKTRTKKIIFELLVNRFKKLKLGETINVEDISFSGFKGEHGSLNVKIGPFKKNINTGKNERIGIGEMVFKIKIDNKIIVNMGDSLLLENEFKKIKNPDILMIPIGGYTTMDIDDAIKAIKIIKPKLVIPTHYNCPALIFKSFNTVNVNLFKKKVEELCIKCAVMKVNDKIIV